MGLKLRGLVRCGRCGRPRGITHTCVNGRRRGRDRLQSPLAWSCPVCGRPRGITHTCRQRTDFAKRRRQADRKRKRQRETARRRERRRKEAARRRERDRARKRAPRPRRQRPRPPAHDYHTCTDDSCQKYGCKAFREGYEEGSSTGSAPDGGGE
jgi:hypothetical protein